MAVEQPAANDPLDSPDHSIMHRVVGVDLSASAEAIRIQADNRFEACLGKCGFTPEGGFFVMLTNKTGGVTTKGYLVEPAAGTDNAFAYAASGVPDVLGIVYDAGIADGAECRIVVSGLAEVYVSADGATRGDFVRMNTGGDTSTASGVATAEAVPGSPFSTDKHFQEVGHALTGRGDAGLITCVIHFN